jgi:hypothetical protein
MLEQISNPTFHKKKSALTIGNRAIWIPSATLSLFRAREKAKKNRARPFFSPFIFCRELSAKRACDDLCVLEMRQIIPFFSLFFLFVICLSR